jgi:hypothetical protein
MSDPGFTRPDLFSIPAVEQAELTAAARGLLSSGSYPSAGNNPLVPDSVLHAFGELDRQHSTGGRCLATGYRGQRTEAGR